MVSLLSLWGPILLSAFLVFVVSSLIHMVLKWHNTDYLKLPNEDDVRAAIRKENPPPGQYVLPHCMDMKAMGNPEMRQKFTDGPVGLLYIKASGMPKMGPPMISWFIFNLVVAFFAAYLAAHTLTAGVHYLAVFRVVGTACFMAYALGSVPAAIWMGKPWIVVLKEIVDGLLYALVMAGTFGWLWPK